MKDFSVSHANTTGGAFPATAAVNATTPTSTDGTEYIKAGIDELWGFIQAFLSETGLTPNGITEVYTNSQILESVRLMSLRYGSAYGMIGRADTDSAHDVIISVGHIPDSTRTMTLRRTAEISKQGDVAWSAGGTPGTPAGGLMGGAWSANTEYGVFEIYNPTTKARDAGFSIYTMSAGIAVPTFLPAGYTIYRMVDWVKTDGSSNIIQTDTSDMGAGNIIKHIKTPILDVNLANTLTTTRRLDAIGVLTGFEVMANINAWGQDGSSVTSYYISYPDSTDLAPSRGTNAPLCTFQSLTTYQAAHNVTIKTNTAKQIASRADTATVDLYVLSLLYFIWNRV